MNRETEAAVLLCRYVGLLAARAELAAELGDAALSGPSRMEVALLDRSVEMVQEAWLRSWRQARATGT